MFIINDRVSTVQEIVKLSGIPKIYTSIRFDIKLEPRKGCPMQCIGECSCRPEPCKNQCFCVAYCPRYGKK